MTTNYKPALDGLRAISIFFVVYGHLSQGHYLPSWMSAGPLGQAGVILFFVLSGYLITTQLQAELRGTGTIRYGIFLGRRAFRLVPAMLLVVGAAAALSAEGYVILQPGSIVHALTYTINYTATSSITTLDHLWSLSVEEQFYLCWPLLLLACGLARSKKVAAAIIFVCPLLRVLAMRSVGPQHILFRHFETAADPIAIGCLLAFCGEEFAGRTKSRLQSSAAVVIYFLTTLGCCVVLRRFWQMGVVTVSVQAMCAAGIIQSLVVARTIFARILASKPFVWVGKLSYSIYLWQQLFLLSAHGKDSIVFKAPLNILLSLLCAVLSYYLVEKPVRDWGRRKLDTRFRSQSALPFDLVSLSGAIDSLGGLQFAERPKIQPTPARNHAD